MPQKVEDLQKAGENVAGMPGAGGPVGGIYLRMSGDRARSIAEPAHPPPPVSEDRIRSPGASVVDIGFRPWPMLGHVSPPSAPMSDVSGSTLEVYRRRRESGRARGESPHRCQIRGCLRWSSVGPKGSPAGG
jgi:hypothetical protein